MSVTDPTSRALVAALCVYVEPLAAGARVAVLGDASSGVAEAMLDLGARSVHVFDPDARRAAGVASRAPRGMSVRALGSDLDLRDAAFDLAVVPDLAELPEPAQSVGRLRRVLDERGSVVALARAHTEGDEGADAPFEYAELYDLFSLRFESVSMTGVLPFGGIVFAELGGSEDVAVSVDTRLAEPEAPSVFVVVAGREPSPLDPYAIVQVPPSGGEGEEGTYENAAHAGAAADEAALAAAQLRAEMLSAQLDEQRARLVVAESRGGDNAARMARALEDRETALAMLRDDLGRADASIARLTLERDALGMRAAELEVAIVQVQQSMLLLERRLASAEEGLLERDDTIASLNAELDTRAAEDGSETHAAETEALEAQLRERAKVVSELEKEIARRDQLVRELVGQIEELREGHAPAPPPAMPSGDREEVERLRRKADELAVEVARRESELVAQSWRIQELESHPFGAPAEADRGEAPPVTLPSSLPPPPTPLAETAATGELARRLAEAEDELAALRQALTQEHAARVRAESGEELERVRAELAQQSVLLEQLRTRAES